jgi:hypothetical protein
MAWDSWPAKRRSKKQVAQEAWHAAIARLAFRFDSDPRKAEDWLASRIRDYVCSPVAESKFCAGIANWLISGNYDDSDEAWKSGDDEPPVSQYQEIAPI